MLRTYLIACALALGMVAAQASESPSTTCPTLAEANGRLQARASYLLEKLEAESKNRPQALLEKRLEEGVATPNLYVALANVIAARAKEEARIWLIDQLSRQICEPDRSPLRNYFPNTCQTIPDEGAFPGPSLNLLRTGLRKDLYALPACVFYLPAPSVPVDAANDEKIDAYVIEAVLLAAHTLSKPKTDPYDGTPALDSPLSKQDIARLLVVVAVARQDPWGWPEGADSKKPNGEEDIQPCFERTQVCLKELRHKLELIIDSESQASAERLVSELLKYLRKWDVDRAAQLEQIATGYYSAIRGDYTETALGLGADLFCRDSSPPEICSRLPLLAEVASAKTQDDMEAALDRVISPLGAWKRKQAERVVALNAMAGVAIGQEELKQNGETATHATMGLYMPIGLEVSWPRPKWGIFRAVAVGATMLDLGAIVSYSDSDSLQGGETSTAANANWSSLTAPGAYVALAFKNSPFRLGLSASRSPELRSVDFSGGVSKDVDSTRYMIFVTVDVTLLSF
jgi:hypothetical protein